MELMENVEVFGFECAIRGMRNPKNSWNLSDSKYEENNYLIGEKDYELASKLINAGSEHRKFLRMIHVQMDITLPRYVWSEFDTYKYNVKNSCSTMHKLLTKEHLITLADFEDCGGDEFVTYHLKRSVFVLNELRMRYIQEGSDKNEILHKAKMLLPESFLQKRTVDTNYEELRNIYKQRKNHRLKIWRDLCNELSSLPYSEFITGEKK